MGWALGRFHVFFWGPATAPVFGPAIFFLSVAHCNVCVWAHLTSALIMPSLCLLQGTSPAAAHQGCHHQPQCHMFAVCLHLSVAE